MSRGGFWCIVITAGATPSLIFAVKPAKNFKNLGIFFSKHFFRLEKHFQVVSA